MTFRALNGLKSRNKYLKILLSIQPDNRTMLGDPSNYQTEFRRSLHKIRDEFGIDGVVLDDEVVLNGDTSDRCGLLKVKDIKLIFTFEESFFFVLQ